MASPYIKASGAMIEVFKITFNLLVERLGQFLNTYTDGSILGCIMLLSSLCCGLEQKTFTFIALFHSTQLLNECIMDTSWGMVFFQCYELS